MIAYLGNTLFVLSEVIAVKHDTLVANKRSHIVDVYMKYPASNIISVEFEDFDRADNALENFREELSAYLESRG